MAVLKVINELVAFTDSVKKYLEEGFARSSLRKARAMDIYSTYYQESFPGTEVLYFAKCKNIL